MVRWCRLAKSAGVGLMNVLPVKPVILKRAYVKVARSYALTDQFVILQPVNVKVMVLIPDALVEPSVIP